MPRRPDTWTADATSTYWPTVWRRKIWFIQWHPATLFAALCIWWCIGYLSMGYTKAELLAPGLTGFMAMTALLLGGIVSLGQLFYISLFAVPKSWRKSEASIGLVEFPCLIGFMFLLTLLNA